MCPAVRPHILLLTVQPTFLFFLAMKRCLNSQEPLSHRHAEPQQIEFEIETHARVYYLSSLQDPQCGSTRWPPVSRLTASAMRQIYHTAPLPASFRLHTLPRGI